MRPGRAPRTVLSRARASAGPRALAFRPFAALADPTRRSILTRLAEGEATVNELAEPFAVSLPAISRHLKVLERAGLIARSREAQWRPSRLRADPLDEAVEWMQSRKQTWEARMDRLDAHLRRKGDER